jgi:GNAT superfamily N-acetyltransferase
MRAMPADVGTADVENQTRGGSSVEEIIIRPAVANDYDQWRLLWEGYNSFYGRSGDTAVPQAIVRSTWERFFDPRETMRVLVAELNGEVVGIAHYLFHRSTNCIENVCYLEDLFTAESKRERGVGRALIQAVYKRAREAGSTRVYWMTHESNAAAIALYAQVAERSGFVVFRRSV